MAHVERVFGTRKAHYRLFCKIISTHINFGKDVSLEWCPIADFSDIESISTTGWQSAQYVSFSHLSLVYFGLLEDFKDVIDEKKIKTFRQVFVLWFLLISSLFLENCCNPDLVDDYVRLFLSSCVTYGMSTKTTTETHISKKSKRQKKRRTCILQRHFKLFQFAELVILDRKVRFNKKPVGRRKGKIHQVRESRNEYNI